MGGIRAGFLDLTALMTGRLPNYLQMGHVTGRLYISRQTGAAHHICSISAAAWDARPTLSRKLAGADHIMADIEPTRHYDGIRRLKATTVIVTRRFDICHAGDQHRPTGAIKLSGRAPVLQKSWEI